LWTEALAPRVQATEVDGRDDVHRKIGKLGESRLRSRRA
jgi:hypothetical protein